MEQLYLLSYSRQQHYKAYVERTIISNSAHIMPQIDPRFRRVILIMMMSFVTLVYIYTVFSDVVPEQFRFLAFFIFSLTFTALVCCHGGRSQFHHNDHNHSNSSAVENRSTAQDTFYTAEDQSVNITMPEPALIRCDSVDSSETMCDVRAQKSRD